MALMDFWGVTPDPEDSPFVGLAGLGNLPILYPVMKTNTHIEAFRALLTDESGQDLIEYALVAALIALGAVASMKTLSGKIGTAFTTIGTSVTSNV